MIDFLGVRKVLLLLTIILYIYHSIISITITSTYTREGMYMAHTHIPLPVEAVYLQKHDRMIDIRKIVVKSFTKTIYHRQKKR